MCGSHPPREHSVNVVLAAPTLTAGLRSTVSTTCTAQTAGLSPLPCTQRRQVEAESITIMPMETDSRIFYVFLVRARPDHPGLSTVNFT